jgi:DNA-binding NtrC family response regulator
VKGNILIVDDDEPLCRVLEQRLTRLGYEPFWCLSAEAGIAAIDERDFDAVVADLNMRGMNGIQFCERVAANRPDLPVVVITAFGSLETAVAAIRAGAYDFITKPLEVEALDLALGRAVQHRSLQQEVRRLRSAVAGAEGFGELIGDSPAIQQLRKLLASVARSEAPVLVCGETGTGKELVARLIHRESARAAGPFVAVNCAAMPHALLESELFGHVKGTLNDARADRVGLCIQANGGTLFLDEVGDLPMDLQPKLLRTLQERRVRPVGGDSEVPFDARVIAATNRDLDSDVEEGRFREDLFYRLEVLRVDLPPLRARAGDVLQMAQHFLQQCAQRTNRRIVGFTAEAADRLLSYTWPGNVRELQNCIERAVALTSREEILVDDLPERVRNYRSDHVIIASSDPSELVSLDIIERRYIHRVLQAVGGNKTLAARILGLDRKTLYRKLESERKRSAAS